MYSTVVDILWTRTWWSFERDRDLPFSTAYHAFNLIEGVAWLVFGMLVLVRRIRGQKSRIEVGYACAFFTFALSDFREAYYQQSWLIWLKLVNLAALFWLRRIVIRRLYPGSKLF